VGNTKASRLSRRSFPSGDSLHRADSWSLRQEAASLPRFSIFSPAPSPKSTGRMRIVARINANLPQSIAQPSFFKKSLVSGNKLGRQIHFTINGSFLARHPIHYGEFRCGIRSTADLAIRKSERSLFAKASGGTVALRHWKLLKTRGEQQL